jgi:ppGpp synthetase/RelA/SpoT-type nucleotidyltranferase
MPIPAPAPQPPFSLEAFSEWYESYRVRFLEPARLHAVRAINELFDEELSERDRIRFDVRPGRVKSKTRAWQKLNNKYASEVSSPADVPRVMDDLVGLRVVCTNSSDLRRATEILDNLEIWNEGDTPVLAVHSADSARNYLGEGKESGYRAYHLNLCTSVSWSTDRHVVVCELQLRTLLQDSWGELTHEDTYKPGGEPSPLVRTLSKRMADLMATLDDMAQDLRDALEELAAEATQVDASGGDVSIDEFSPADRDAARQYLIERASTLGRPIDWASLAFEMQREFGQGIVKGWFGHGAFKELLASTIPAEQLFTETPGYVLPRGFTADSYSLGSTAEVPRSARLLHETDKTFPLASTESWREAYTALAHATNLDGIDQQPSPVAALTKAARDAARNADVIVTRRQLDHIARVLAAARELRSGMSEDEVSQLFRDWTVSRAAPFCASPDERAELDTWLGG